MVDPDYLAQILSNLLQNASRYTDDGGDVDVRVEPRGGAVEVEVTNTGSGIPAEDLPRIFERFYRVDKSRSRAAGGAGVGLAIVKQLVASAGGDLAADSRPGRTRFRVRLPSAQQTHGHGAYERAAPNTRLGNLPPGRPPRLEKRR